MIISRTLLHYFTSIAILISFCPLFISIFNRKYIKGEFVFLTIIFGVSALSEVVNYFLVQRKINTFPVFHFYTFFEFGLYVLFYLNYLKLKKSALIFWVQILVVPIIVIIDFKINSLYKMDTLSTSTESMMLSGYSLYLFYIMLKLPILKNITSAPIFWVNSAVLIYFMGNLMVFLFSNYIQTYQPEKSDFLWSSIHSFFNLTYSIVMSIGIWKLRKA